MITRAGCHTCSKNSRICMPCTHSFFSFKIPIKWLCRNHCHNALSAIERVTPSPPEGEATQGGMSPLDPQFFFQMRVYGHAPRGEGRQTPSARGSITIPLQVFYRADKMLFHIYRRGELEHPGRILHALNMFLSRIHLNGC